MLRGADAEGKVEGTLFSGKGESVLVLLAGLESVGESGAGRKAGMTTEVEGVVTAGGSCCVVKPVGRIGVDVDALEVAIDGKEEGTDFTVASAGTLVLLWADVFSCAIDLLASGRGALAG